MAYHRDPSLGHYFCLLYVNDFENSSSVLSFILFADDSNLFVSDSNINHLVHTVNNELKSAANWFTVNGLSLNTAKTNYMLFSNSASDLPGEVKINDSIIKQTNCCNFLGLFIDSGLTWKSHIDYICKIIARNIGVINRIKHFFPGPVLDSLYNTLVVSYINYGILAWGGSSSKNLNILLLPIQRLNTRGPCSGTHLLANLNPQKIFILLSVYSNLLCWKLIAESL